MTVAADFPGVSDPHPPPLFLLLLLFWRGRVCCCPCTRKLGVRMCKVFTLHSNDILVSFWRTFRANEVLDMVKDGNLFQKNKHLHRMRACRFPFFMGEGERKAWKRKPERPTLMITRHRFRASSAKICGPFLRICFRWGRQGDQSKKKNCTSFILYGKFGSPYLSKATALARAALPISNSACCISMRLKKGMAANASDL